jgi:LacI family transcriptional regulator
MTASLRDVARTAGVSVGTVSNVLNRPSLVSPQTLERVQSVINELGFVPNGFARHLRSGYSRTIGLVVPDVANPFFTEVARGVEDAASKRDYAVFLCNSDESTIKETKYLNALVEQKVRGVLITPADNKPQRLDMLTERGIAVTLLDRESMTGDQCSVAVDDVRGGEIAIEHLASLGHRTIAWVNGPESIPQCADRGIGVNNAARVAGVNISTIRVPLMNGDQGVMAVKAILALEKPATAIFCANDLLALGVMRALLAEGITIPSDLSIMGYDDIAFAPSATVPLTSISQPAYQLGVAAAELLLAECEEATPHSHQQIRFQPRLAIRQSTGLLEVAEQVEQVELPESELKPGAKTSHALAPTPLAN